MERAEGPRYRRQPVTERDLHKLARNIPLDKVEPVAFRLGFVYADVKRYKQLNMSGSDVTYAGTGEMLQAWYQKTSDSDCNDILREALLDSDLKRIAEKFL